ncbi:hypothetical protein ABFS82_06G184100 [Erythranthe guttata]|uniref:zinc finger protein ZAT5 n=1 Tax=Erythranthe guttata TaxID=4155 RepID=UPI00064DCDED|nr:PREDICTED: zinc finger protein ZAT5 [Erythranthe guttata]|eukprot:XP_012834577.1 PREDICTED: zinc finger protein ZAT5 [Erythranthe guttata]
MEAVEEVAAPPCRNNTTDLSPIAKGKRTKRLRTHSPIPFTITPPPPAADHHPPRRSPTSSEESTTTEEVETARCLILLSRGHFPPLSPKPTRTGGGGACVYTCKTCNRAFPSFQALGGHRASHKKPRNDKRAAMFSDEEDFPSPSMSSFRNRISPNSLSLQLSNISTTAAFSAAVKSSPSPRIHECSYCGAEFTSGQALGGHMRKHRGGPILNRSPNNVQLLLPEASIEELELAQSKKTRPGPGPGSGLSLDLNLPAPEDNHDKEKERPLINCHY